jgi:hypothetical protein
MVVGFGYGVLGWILYKLKTPKIELISKKKHEEIRKKNLPGAQTMFNRRLGRISTLLSSSFSTVAFKMAHLECSQHRTMH